MKLVASPTPETTPLSSPQPSAVPTGAVPPVAMPDLVVESVSVAPQQDLAAHQVTLTITIRNDGSVEAANGFWVELFIDPPKVPTVNTVFVPEGHGALWYVPRLAAGETLTLSLEEMDDRYSNFVGRFSAGRHELYVYVDAYNTEGEVGLVAEADEGNNLHGPLILEVGAGSHDGSEPAKSGPSELLWLVIRRLEQFLRALRGGV